jgi:hypothetical protein
MFMMFLCVLYATCTAEKSLVAELEFMLRLELACQSFLRLGCCQPCTVRHNLLDDPRL